MDVVNAFLEYWDYANTAAIGAGIGLAVVAGDFLVRIPGAAEAIRNDPEGFAQGVRNLGRAAYAARDMYRLARTVIGVATGTAAVAGLGYRAYENLPEAGTLKRTLEDFDLRGDEPPHKRYRVTSPDRPSASAMRGEGSSGAAPAAAREEVLQSRLTSANPRGLLAYCDRALQAGHPLDTVSPLLQLHMTDFIVEGTGQSNNRLGRAIYSQSIHLKGLIQFDPVFAGTPTTDQFYIIEFGVVYDKSGNAGEYLYSELFSSDDASVGSYIFHQTNMANSARFRFLLRRRYIMNYPDSIFFTNVDKCARLIDEHVQLPNLVTVYPDGTSPPNTGEIFIYAVANKGDNEAATRKPFLLYLQARLRYYSAKKDEYLDTKAESDDFEGSEESGDSFDDTDNFF